ncbi:MAG: glycogen debranching protein, partial [Cellulosilyticaceae bacterium]
MYSFTKGYPSLGCQIETSGMQFGIYAPDAFEMRLNIYLEETNSVANIQCSLTRSEYVTGDLFHIFIDGLSGEIYYTWQMVDEQGVISQELLDPYAKKIIAVKGEKNIYRAGSVTRKRKSFVKPQIPLSETIIYELHVGLFTKSETSDVGECERGCFEGLIHKLPYLKKLGITTIELMPIFKWNAFTLKHTHPGTKELVTDVWGYNPICFFAIDDRYQASDHLVDIIDSFHELVDHAHEQGLEIVLDVVYNHTGEGGDDGTVFHFKELAREAYYKIKDNTYLNCSGTGNTLNCTHPVVKQMVLDSLRYWAVEMGVDGFRFDLASILGQDEYGRWMQYSLLDDIAQDPILSHVKLISESWDAKGCYDVGRMPYPFAEWSDYFRDTMRRFVRGDMGLTRAVATCIMGEEVYYKDTRKNGQYSIHFISAHDGFTLWDLLSYDKKHNIANGEEDRDGNNANYSANYGTEGETQDPTIYALRKRQAKNFFALLFLSKGIPMFLMGDEMGRTQQGNNNAYCQDNDMAWVDWDRGKQFGELTVFVEQMIHLRKKMACFEGYTKSSVTWHGVNYERPDWAYYSRTLAWHYKGEHENMYIIVNSYTESLFFELPPTHQSWCIMIDTFEDA